MVDCITLILIAALIVCVHIMVEITFLLRRMVSGYDMGDALLFTPANQVNDYEYQTLERSATRPAFTSSRLSSSGDHVQTLTVVHPEAPKPSTHATRQLSAGNMDPCTTVEEPDPETFF